MCSKAAEIIAATTISKVWVGLGGDEPRHNRGKAFWRDGHGQNVSLDDAKGVWHDHKDGAGGGVLDLIQKARGCTRVEALKWLADFAGIPLDEQHSTPAERRRYTEQRDDARRVAREIGYWRRAAILELNEAKLIDDDSPRWRSAASLCHSLENGSADDVAREWRRCLGEDEPNVRRLIIAGAEREQLEKQVTQDAVDLIASAVEADRAREEVLCES
jgi:hypothetical protein